MTIVEFNKGAPAPGAKPATLEVWDWSEFVFDPPPIKWLVQDLIPADIAGDIYGPPGVGKSTLAYHLAISCAAGIDKWFGRPLAGGPVLIVGGESSGRAAHHRAAHRMMRSAGLDLGDAQSIQDALRGRMQTIRTGRILMWDRRVEDWTITPAGEALIDLAVKMKPAFVLLDTIASATGGSDMLDYTQQYALGEKLGDLQRLTNTTLLTVSHTNQMSQGSLKPIKDRLHYTARAGGNGAPGAWRWMLGVTRLQDEEAAKISTSRRNRYRNLIAVGVGKANEIPMPSWAWDAPAIFEIDHDGLHLEVEGEAVRIQLEDVKKGGRRKGDAASENEATYSMEDFSDEVELPALKQEGEWRHGKITF